MDSSDFTRLTDPIAFRQWYRIDTDSRPQPWESVAEPQQLVDHTAIVPGIRRVLGLPSDGGFSRCYLERPRAGGKTSDLGMMAANILFGSKRKVRGLALAGDADQAALLRAAIDDGIEQTPGLDRFLTVQRNRVVNEHTGSELIIMSSDTATSWGPTPHFALVDELSNWQNRVLWDSVVSSVGKRADALLLVGSNAGFGKGSSWHWHLREACRVDPLWHFGRFEGPPARLTESRLAEQRRLLTPGSYNRVWGNAWQVGGGDSFSEETIREACRFEGPMLRPSPEYHAGGFGLDLGLTKHHAALVAIMVDGIRERVRVARVQNFRPPVQIESVYQAILDMANRFGIKTISFDPWQATHLAERLEAKGFNCNPVPPTAANMNAAAVSLWDGIQNKMLDLYADPLLVEDLLGCEIIEQRTGYRLELATNENGHGDRLSALCTVLPSAFAGAASIQPAIQSSDRFGGNLLQWKDRQDRMQDQLEAWGMI